MILSLRHLNFTCNNIVDQGFAQFFKFFDLGVDGFNNAVNVGGFGIEVIGDGFLFSNFIAELIFGKRIPFRSSFFTNSFVNTYDVFLLSGLILLLDVYFI